MEEIKIHYIYNTKYINTNSMKQDDPTLMDDHLTILSEYETKGLSKRSKHLTESTKIITLLLLFIVLYLAKTNKTN